MLWFFVTFLLGKSSGFLLPYPVDNEIVWIKNVTPKIIITPYVEAGNIKEALDLTLVEPLKGNIVSYAGYVTVDKNCDSNLFFWFFPGKNFEKSPVSVWLQGGPGASSLYGLLTENGPYELTPSGKIKIRKYPWTEISSYIYIDNPVGTGFSYAKNESCYSKNQNEVGRNLLVGIKQILKLFPTLSSNPFYVTGESYAGKYVPALAYAMHKDNSANDKINLKGLAIGNGLVDPYNQLIYSDYLYQLGIIDDYGKDYMKKEEDSCRDYISKNNWIQAFRCFDELLNGDMTNGSTFFNNVTGFSYYFNYLYSNGRQEGDINNFLNKPYVSFPPYSPISLSISLLKLLFI